MVTALTEQGRRWLQCSALEGCGQTSGLDVCGAMDIWNSEMIFKDYAELDSTNAEAKRFVDKG